MLDVIYASHVELRDAGVSALVGPVALAVTCAQRDGDAMVAAAAPVPVACCVELQDEQLTLVGFASAERRALYRALRGVNGIGRRSALAVLDCGEVLDILRAVAGRDNAFFREVPGLGPKRVGAMFDELERRYRQSMPRKLNGSVSWTVQAREALTVEGVSHDAADGAAVAAVEGARSAQDAVTRARALLT